MIEIFIEGTEILVQKFDNWYPTIEKIVASGAQIVEDEVRNMAPVKTGRLRDSIHQEKISPLHIDVVVGGERAPYATYVIFGTRPHVIVPVHAKALHFVTDEGEEVFTKRVMHPGYAGFPFPRLAIEFALQKFTQIFSQILVEVFRK